MQLRCAFWTGSGEVRARRQHRGTAKTTSRRHILHQPGKTRTRDVKRGTWALRFLMVAGSVAILAFVPAVFLISALRILAVTVHAEWLLLELIGFSCAPLARNVLVAIGWKS
jgi:hypothetical protein